MGRGVVVRLFSGNPCSLESRSQCLKCVLLLLIVWICMIFLGFFETGVGPLVYTPIARLVQGSPTQASEKIAVLNLTGWTLAAHTKVTDSPNSRKLTTSRVNQSILSTAAPDISLKGNEVKNTTILPKKTSKSVKSESTTAASQKTSKSTVQNATSASNKESGKEPVKVLPTASHAGTTTKTPKVSQNKTDSHRSLTTPSSRTPATASPLEKPPSICTFPLVNPFDSVIQPYFKRYATVNCSDGVPNLVYVTGHVLNINYTKVPTAMVNNSSKFLGCKYHSKTRAKDSDRKTALLRTSSIFNTSIEFQPTDEYLQVECLDSAFRIISRSYFSLTPVKKDLEKELEDNYKKHVALHSPKETLSVLVIGIDGMSKQNFQRSMPKTRAFLQHVLNATELHKYNKLADNTFPNVMPLLTGKFAPEFLDGNWTWKKPFDAINDAFLWSDYHKAGWRTAMMLDESYITAFHYQKKGWYKSPVDYYSRGAVIDSEKDSLMRKNRHCFGDIPAVTLLHDYWVQLASTFNNTNTKPYFGYSFSVTLTHDDQNKATAADELYARFLAELVDKNVLNNTVLIFFSDHGPRFGGMRSTYNGVVEARTPYLFIAFPPWFHRKYPHLMKVLKINQQRLTTHFDVYATMRDLLYFKAETGKGNLTQRGISLFREIPADRNCQHIGIPSQYCVCNHLSKAKVSPNLAQFLAFKVMDHIRDLTNSLRKKCVRLDLKTVQNILEAASDAADAKNSTTEASTKYQLTITTEPGDALYEATVNFFPTSSKATVLGEVTRLNMYKGQAECIEDPNLRPYCYCKDKDFNPFY